MTRKVRVSRDLEDVRQLLARAAQTALALGGALVAPSPGEDAAARRRRELLAYLAQAMADEVADVLEAVNAIADALAEPRPRT